MSARSKNKRTQINESTHIHPQLRGNRTTATPRRIDRTFNLLPCVCVCVSLAPRECVKYLTRYGTRVTSPVVVVEYKDK